MCAICDFKIEFNVSHPHALTVAVATREAVEAGVLPEQVFDGALGSMKMRVVAIDTLGRLQSRMETSVPPAQLAGLPDFYVLLVDSGTWGFFHATESGFDPDIVPEIPEVFPDNQAERDITLIAAQATIRAILDGRVELDHAMHERLVMLDADDVAAQAIVDVLRRACGAHVDAPL
nr:hypothetical protein HUO10_003354 [Paraburkholderia busanensis]